MLRFVPILALALNSLFLTTIDAQTCGVSYVQQRLIKNVGEKGHRIVGGVEARPNSFPWIVSIQREGRQHFCGGSLFRLNSTVEATDIIVTAAHCVADGLPYGTEVAAGAHDVGSVAKGEQRAKVLLAEPHPGYDPNSMVNDIALLKLATPIKFTQTTQPPCLPSPNEVVPDNTMGTVAGWGYTKEGAWQSSQVLNQVGVPVVNSNVCTANYKQGDDPMVINSKVMLCAGYAGGGKDSCQGDSGGPLTFKNAKNNYVLHGVVSFGEGCARAGKPGIYARVSSFIDYLQKRSAAMTSIKPKSG